jgi:SAM-dependent MidA family methyltransferase
VSTLELLGDRRLVGQIIATIERAEHRSISFHDYMNMCLYQAGSGYYMKSESKIGKDGDFYTSSSIGPFMGQLLAARFAQYILENKGRQLPTITEWGSGAGKLALQILDELQNTYPEIYNHITYDLIEVSPYHQELQRELLHVHTHKVRFIDAQSWWKMPPLHDAIIFSNELLDAFPIHLVKKFNGHYQEVHVSYDQTTGQFIEDLRPIPEGEELAAYLEQYQITGAEGHTVEINLAADSWIRRIESKLLSGMLVTIDYGDEASELYAGHRHNGTLMCYHQHLAHHNPYIHIGNQDITSHVNFSSCIRVGYESGFTSHTYQTQRQFLIDQGILSKLQDHAWTDPFHPVVKSNRAIRQLLIGDSMGELFKVLIQHKK